MNRNKITTWSVFREFMNSKNIGEIITRQEILLHTNEEFIKAGLFRVQNGLRYATFANTTVDATRNMSTGAGFLEKTDKDGIYKVKKKFPRDYTVTKLRKDYETAILLNIFTSDTDY